LTYIADLPTVNNKTQDAPQFLDAHHTNSTMISSKRRSVSMDLSVPLRNKPFWARAMMQVYSL